MTEAELKEFCRKYNDGKPFMTQNSIMKMLGISHASVKELLKGLHPMYGHRTCRNPSHLYFVDDIAKAIIRKGYM